MEKRPLRKDFEKQFPNAGFDRYEHHVALENWAIAAETKIKELENKLAAQECSLVIIDPESLQICIDMYKRGEKLLAIKWLIEESERTANKFGIKWAHEYFQSLGLEKIDESIS